MARGDLAGCSGTCILIESRIFCCQLFAYLSPGTMAIRNGPEMQGGGHG